MKATMTELAQDIDYARGEESKNPGLARRIRAEGEPIRDGFHRGVERKR